MNTLNILKVGNKLPDKTCGVCGSPSGNSMTLVAGKWVWSCSNECAEMLQRRRMAAEKLERHAKRAEKGDAA